MRNFLSSSSTATLIGLLLLSPLLLCAQNFKPDLVVSSISTPNGFCIGNSNRVKVTVSNKGPVGTSKAIKVLLYLEIPGAPTSIQELFVNGIGPNDNAGQSVYFNNVNVPFSSTATLRARLDPDNTIAESNEQNNIKVRQAQALIACNSRGSVQNAGVTVTTYHQGTWKNGNYKAAAGTEVILKKGQQVIGRKYTNKQGQVYFPSVPLGQVRIYASRNGCLNANKNYTVPAILNARVNLAIRCAGQSENFKKN